MPDTRAAPASQWFLYLLECADGSVYTGITTDVERRFEQHRNGIGARYTRSRTPVAVMGSLPCADRSEASRLEAAVKRLRAEKKHELVQRIRSSEPAAVLAWLAAPRGKGLGGPPDSPLDP
ncbi:GIY-YIG nuclease family protein [Cupriavidus sp. AU9028]|uniref:GIY-YIG nuclease family protein n=1 Tax=Cupriavidus sp. AU9028 TaxID=2871157 RepID=UPI001C969E16|nr:GIY-YIG nuclease family protein [Cupriavidus sp. AU9028]